MHGTSNIKYTEVFRLQCLASVHQDGPYSSLIYTEIRLNSKE